MAGEQHGHGMGMAWYVLISLKWYRVFMLTIIFIPCIIYKLSYNNQPNAQCVRLNQGKTLSFWSNATYIAFRDRGYIFVWVN
jgi:hypothetical protein